MSTEKMNRSALQPMSKEGRFYIPSTGEVVELHGNKLVVGTFRAKKSIFKGFESAEQSKKRLSFKHDASYILVEDEPEAEHEEEKPSENEQDNKAREQYLRGYEALGYMMKHGVRVPKAQAERWKKVLDNIDNEPIDNVNKRLHEMSDIAKKYKDTYNQYLESKKEVDEKPAEKTKKRKEAQKKTAKKPSTSGTKKAKPLFPPVLKREVNGVEESMQLAVGMFKDFDELREFAQDEDNFDRLRFVHYLLPKDIENYGLIESLGIADIKKFPDNLEVLTALFMPETIDKIFIVSNETEGVYFLWDNNIPEIERTDSGEHVRLNGTMNYQIYLVEEEA